MTPPDDFSKPIAEREAEIGRLEERAEVEKEARDKVNKEVKKLAEERAELLQDLRKQLEKARDTKAKRDELRKTLQEEKNALDTLFTQLQTHKQEAATHRQAAEQLRRDVGRGAATLESKLQEREWYYQTTVMSLDEEKEIVKEITELENRLRTARKLSEERDSSTATQAEVQATRIMISGAKDRIAKAREQVNEQHVLMEEAYQATDALRARVAEIEQRIEGLRHDANSHHTAYLSLRKEAAGISESIREEVQTQMEKKSERVKEEKKAVAAQLYSKYQEGEKLSKEELQLLVEFGYL